MMKWKNANRMKSSSITVIELNIIKPANKAIIIKNIGF